MSFSGGKDEAETRLIARFGHEWVAGYLDYLRFLASLLSNLSKTQWWETYYVYSVFNMPIYMLF